MNCRAVFTPAGTYESARDELFSDLASRTVAIPPATKPFELSRRLCRSVLLSQSPVASKRGPRIDFKRIVSGWARR
jgi:hypothetical protein